MVSLDQGSIQRISWSEGLVNFAMSFDINQIQFGLELQHFRGSTISSSGTCASVKALTFSPKLAGFVVTLSDGRAGLLTSPEPRFDPRKLQAVWAKEVVDATGCQSVNDCYRLLCYGLSSGRIAVYSIGELNGSLCLVTNLEVSIADCPDAHQRCGPVTAMSWSPDQRVVAVAWKNQGVAVFSVFGSLLFLSLTSLPAQWAPLQSIYSKQQFLTIKSLDWSPEGYQLWMTSDQGQPLNFATFSLAKSALTTNTCENNHQHVLLQSDTCLYVGLVDRLHSPLVDLGHGMAAADNEAQGPAAALSIIPIAPEHLQDNWPISLSCISDSGDWLAVAGRTGLACFSLKRRHWRLFGNVSQERDFTVTGGLLMWREFVACACYNSADRTNELRFYPLTGRLDNSSASIFRLDSIPYQMNCVHDSLVIFSHPAQISVYCLRKRLDSRSSPQVVERQRVAEVSIDSFVATPSCVTHVALTTLSTDVGLLTSASAMQHQHQPLASRPNSLLVTASGRVLLLQADRPIASQGAVFSTPVPIAEKVEHLWLMLADPIGNAALAETIWLHCGSHGANIWLPLFSVTKSNSHAFLSKRVMLPIDCPIYPLTALLSVASVVGATSETTASAFLPPTSPIAAQNGRIWRMTATRTSHSYLPSILRQLLRRHLGLQALEVTRSWSHLQNFPHVLELLLHQVVDDEALSKEPLPDPLLPRVVAFIQQFPEHAPAVIVQCARKMEAVLWPYLFATVGPPRDLFSDCLKRHDLDTASQYLIIIHTSDQSSVSRKLTAEFLQCVLEAKRFSLTCDILRFLRTIGSANVTLHSSPASRKQSTTGNTPPPRASFSSGSGGKEAEVPVDVDVIDKVVLPFLKKLLHQKRLLDLGHLAAAVDEATHHSFQLAQWLKMQRLASPNDSRLVDFVAALHKFHHEFEWPYPVLIQQPNSSSNQEGQPPQSLLPLARIANNNGNGSAATTSVAGQNDENRYFSPDQVDDIELIPKQFAKGEEDLIGFSDSASMLSHSESLPSLVSDAAVAVPIPNHSSAATAVFKQERHVKHLLSVFLEAGWHDWALLLSILLRDAKHGVEAVRNLIKMLQSPEFRSDHDNDDDGGIDRQDISRDEKQHEQLQEVASGGGIGGGGDKSKDEAEKRANKLKKESAKQAIVVIVRDVCVGFAQFVTWSSQSW